MNERLVSRGWFIPGVMFAAFSGCGGDGAPVSKENAASVSNPRAETALTQVTLSAEAFSRLRIQTVNADSTDLGSVRTLGGDVVVPPGNRADVVAPVAGKVIIPADVRGRLGAAVAAGTPIVRLVPIPTGTDLVRTAEEVRIAEARYAQTRAEEQRVRALRNEKLVSERDLERAVADLRAAEAARDAAVARHRLIETGSSGSGDESNALTALTIAAPMAGVLLDLNVGSGQVVTAGTPLFTVASLGRLWVKVSLYAGDARTIARGQRVTVHGLSSGTGGFAVSARPATAPLSADPRSSSVDLFYQLDEPRGLRPGERVSISLPVAGPRRQALVVPLSAVLYDVTGDAWVYVRTDSLVFTRRRIEVANVVGDRVVVTRGLERGMPVVIAGAAELFGIEFGPGK